MTKKVHYMDATTGEYGSFEVDQNTHPLDAATADDSNQTSTEETQQK